VYGSGGEFRRASDFLYDGESILFGRKGTVDRPLYVDGKFWTVDTMYYAVPLEQVNGRFLYYLSTTIPFNYYVTSTALPSVTQSDLAGHPVNIPPLGEQRAIADYLDRETQKIDELIAEQRGLIELLQERRRAAISSAVLGVSEPRLDIDRPDVGSQWSWIPLLRTMKERVDYRGATPTKTDEGVQLVTARNVRMGWIDYLGSQEYIDPVDYDSVMHRGFPALGDILFTMEAPLGNVAMVDRSDIALAQRIVKFRVDPELAISRFIMYEMMGQQFQAQLHRRASGSTALGIKASKLSSLSLALPSLQEQSQIVADLDEQTSRLDELIAESDELIALSEERRAALITAAVTGQIDVRTV